MVSARVHRTRLVSKALSGPCEWRVPRETEEELRLRSYFLACHLAG